MASQGDFVGLIKDYERDVLEAKELETPPAGPKSDENRVRRAADLMSRHKYGKARKEMLNNGLANKDDPRVVEQMKVKHPARKEEMTPLSDGELSHDRRGIDREVFMKELGKLDHDVAEGLGGLRNEHLTALLFNPHREVTPGAEAAADDLYAFADNVVNLTDKLIKRTAKTGNFIFAINRNALSKVTVSFRDITHRVAQLGEWCFYTGAD